MPRQFRPFLLNSNVCGNAAIVSTYDKLMSAVNYNTGNSYIAYAVLKGLFGNADAVKTVAGITNIWQDDLRGQAERINKHYSHALLFLQDQIRADNDFRGWDEVNSFIEKLRIPIVVFSLGANSLSGWDANLHNKLAPGLIRFLHLLADRTAMLGIRGEFTAEVLTNLEIVNHEITGCPSYFECGRGRRVLKPEWDPDANVVATGLFSTTVQARLHYVLQSEPILLEALFSGSSYLDSLEFGLLDSGYPGYRECVTQALRDKRVSMFFDPGQWKEFIAQGFAFAIGTRLHGAIIAINAGIPALVTNGDMRAREVTDYFGIPLLPGICGREFDMRDLYELSDIDSLNCRYDAAFTNYCNWLRVNGLRYVEGSHPMVAETEPRRFRDMVAAAKRMIS